MVTEKHSFVGLDRKAAKFVREASFKLPSACIEDVLYLKGRKLSKDRVLKVGEVLLGRRLCLT